ncbi:hypothetical protein BV22DRAFT_1051586 [Leucogyrophana mollusca]|uniref:Uncharacterized protein n=1 Tax=Leucogyrophana mollusca TaxID=85980 RepID=A0ACB8B0N4_9AGAM|nr:hypothetical protein BV22DRAFT_1051586 [Leucogyrophana mollusca]
MAAGNADGENGIDVPLNNADWILYNKGEAIPGPTTLARVQLAKTHSTATFYAPSDPSGVGSMHREHICACPIWQNEHAQYDCVFVSFDSDSEGMRALEIARIMAFFPFVFEEGVYPCAVVHWFEKTDADADEDTGMCIVRPGFHEDQSRHLTIIHTDTISNVPANKAPPS